MGSGFLYNVVKYNLSPFNVTINDCQLTCDNNELCSRSTGLSNDIVMFDYAK